jgi:hypothetical protein
VAALTCSALLGEDRWWSTFKSSAWTRDVEAVAKCVALERIEIVEDNAGRCRCSESRGWGRTHRGRHQLVLLHGEESLGTRPSMKGLPGAAACRGDGARGNGHGR